MPISTYDPAKVLASFAGFTLTGFADGTFIEAERNEDGFTLTVGAAGEGVRSQSRNRSGRITLTVLASSPTNDFLSALAAQDELLGTGTGEFMIKELESSTGIPLVHAEDCWIMKLPKQTREKTVSNVEWVFEAKELDVYPGGLI